MNIGLFAYGRTGCKIADRFKRFEKRTRHHVTEFIMAADTSTRQLNSLQRIDDDWQVLYGYQEFEGDGTRADLEPAVEVAEQTTGNIMNAAGTIDKTEIDAFVVIGSLGGGSGAGGAPVCAKVLSDNFETIPVYGVGILPSRREPDLFTLNAARALQSFSRETDNLLLFDNDHLNVSLPDYNPSVPDDTPPGDVFGEINQDIARCLHMLFTADEKEPSSDLEGAVIDTETLIKVLATGGLSTMCYTTATLPRAAQPGITGRISELIEYIKYRHADRKYRQQNENDDVDYDDTTEQLQIGDSTSLSIGVGNDSSVESQSDDVLFTDSRSIELVDLPVIPQPGDEAYEALNADSEKPSLERDWPHPTKLVPLTLDSSTAMMDMEPAQTSRNLFLLSGPEQHLSEKHATATTDWADEHTASGFPVGKVYPMKSKKVGVLTVCSGIGIPQRIQEIQDEGVTIAQRILQKQQQKAKPKQVNVFENSQSKVPPSF